MKFDGADTYPVGVLSTLQQVGRALTVAKGRRIEFASKALRKQWHYLTRQVNARNWRAVRNSFNGYLCEHDAHPHNAGRGWTKRAAIRRADRICGEALRSTPAEWWPAA